MRATWDLLHLDLASAVGSNVLAVATIALIGWAFIRWWLQLLPLEVGSSAIVRIATSDPLQMRYASLLAAVVIPTFWILRNLPAFSALAP